MLGFRSLYIPFNEYVLSEVVREGKKYLPVVVPGEEYTCEEEYRPCLFGAWYCMWFLSVRRVWFLG